MWYGELDINLKNNKNKSNSFRNAKSKVKTTCCRIKDKFKSISVNRRILFISICISFLPILFGCIDINEFTNRKDVFNCEGARSEIQRVCDILNQLNGYLEDGALRESEINDEIDDIKIKEKEENPDKEYSKSEEEYKKEAIRNIKENVENINTELKKYVNIEYYVQNKNGNKITNIFDSVIISDTLMNYRDYMIYDEKNQSSDISSSMKCFTDLMGDNMNYKTVVLRISNPLKGGDEIYNRVNVVNRGNNRFVISVILLIVDILVILSLIFVRKKDLEYKENAMERAYSKLFIEIKIVILICIVMIFRNMYESIYGGFYYGDAIVQVILYSTFIYLSFSDVYKIAHRKAEINSMFVAMKNAFNKNISSMFKNKPLLYNLLLVNVISIGSIILFIELAYEKNAFNKSWIFCSLLIIVLNFILYLYITLVFININKIKNLTDNIVSGDFKTSIKVKELGLLNNIASNIMNIKSGFNNALEEAVKSERMKTELITNVSHDLKTPLTSIINYVDLLSKDNASKEDKKKYLEVLNDRSLRLKVLIEDLFEAAKATSGTLKYKLEDLDPVALLRQSLGEFEDKLEERKLTTIKNIPYNKLSIRADGKKTFRVIQNLLSNITKYSMKSSRVYIDVIEEEKYVLLVFKNMSEAPLNFTEEEILERFKRGDSSRTTEGNGLGLSIAKSLTEGQDGKFKIIIDGDLFKVEIRLRKNILKN